MEDQQTSMTPKQQTVDRLKNSVSVVVTLSNQPTADEYASAIGLVQILRRFGKKASVVTNTPLPRELTFLSPGEAVTSKLDHLRDFVIELDKDKADKLRYEPSDAVVKIFITPYKQEITQADLRFSQGNYNVDTLIAIGATAREAIDGALKDHGQLLHDALIVTLSAGDKLSSFGAINWQEPTASTVAEMLVSVADALQNGLLDQGTSQVLLTALVAATDRFHNHKTTPKVMTIAAQLIAAGADPQVVMSQFEGVSAPQPNPAPQSQANKLAKAAPTPPQVPATDSRSLSISHEANKGKESGTKKRAQSHRSPAHKQKTTSAPVAPVPVASTPIAPPVPAPIISSPQTQQLPAETTVRTSGTDNQLAADAIDALMESTQQAKDEYNAQPALDAQLSDIPLMQHQSSLSPNAPSVPTSTPLATPTAQPTIPSPAPLVSAQPYSSPAVQPGPTPIPQPATDIVSVDAARQAVEQAMSQIPGSAPVVSPAPQSQQPAADIFVAPDGTLQYATPPAGQ